MERFSRRILIKAGAGLFAFIPAARILLGESSIAHALNCSCAIYSHSDPGCEYCSFCPNPSKGTPLKDWYAVRDCPNQTACLSGQCDHNTFCFWTYNCGPNDPGSGCC